MTLDRRQMAIVAGHLRAALDLVAPPPGEDTPPPPPPQPGPGTPPTVTTLAASTPTATTVTLNGDLLSLGNVDSETPRTTVDVFFQWRVVGAGTWTETTPVAQVAPGPFNLGLTGLTPATAHEVWAAVTSEAGTVFGAVLGFTSDEVTIPDPPADNFLDLTAGATYALTASNGTVTGITGAWETAGVNPERQAGVTSLVVGDLVPSIGVRNQRYVIANADLALAATFTCLLVLQRRALSPRPWMTVLARDDGQNQIGGSSIGLTGAGGARFNVRLATTGSANAIDLPAGTIVDGDTVKLIWSVGAAGARIRCNGGTAVVNAGITSIGTSVNSRTILGTSQTGASPWDCAFAGLYVWNGVQLTAGQEDAIFAQLKTRIQWAPPITVSGEVGDITLVDVPDKAFMAAPFPTSAVTVQPANATAVAAPAAVIELTLDSAGTDATGRYTLTDDNGTSPAAVITVVATDVVGGEPPPEITVTRVGTGNSGEIVEGTSRTATWADSFVPAAGDLIIAWVCDAAGVTQPATIPGYALLRANEQALTLTNFRQRGDLPWKVAGGSEPASVTASHSSPARARLNLEAFRVPAPYAFTSPVSQGANTGAATGKASLALALPAGTLFVWAGWSGRHANGTPEPTNLRLQNMASSPWSANGAARLRGATGYGLFAGGQTITEGVEHDG